jgi:hypothetical protein
MYARFEKIIVDAFQKDYNWFGIKKYKPVPGQLLGLKEFTAMMIMNMIVANLLLLIIGFIFAMIYDRFEVLTSLNVWFALLALEFSVLFPMVGISFYIWNRADDGGRRGEY